MNLESIEQRCLAYLQEVSKPMVPIAQLLRVVHEDEDSAHVTENDLLAFLRKHELFTVIEPQGLAESGGNANELEAAGILTSPSVILATRLPSKNEMVEAMQQQMGTMLNALEAAVSQARGENNPRLAMEVQAILKRARELQQKMDEAGLA